jgi:hypothetical protein
MTDARVELGYAIMALHEPDHGYEAAFNRWYERDHFYGAALFAPYTMAGQRWVGTAELKDLRYPEDGPFDGPSRLGSFLTLFWIQAGHLEDQQMWVAKEQERLVPAGRTFDKRSVQTATVHRFLTAGFRDPDGVPAEQALDHRYPGLVWTWLERTGSESLEELSSWLMTDLLRPRFERSPVAMTLAFTPMPKAPWWPKAAPEVPGVGERIVLLHFVEATPSESWDPYFAKLGPSLEETGRVRVRLVAPFIPTVPGTDSYTDQLW